MAARIIGLVGPKRGGKDTVAQILMAHDTNFVRGAFADRLKEMAYELNPYVLIGTRAILLQDAVADCGDEAKDWPDVRRIYQNFGMVLRAEPDYWIRWLDQHVYRTLPRHQCLVITDVRMSNEIEYVRSLGGQLWRIDRPAVEDGDQHPSEREWRTAIPDTVIANTGDLGDLTRAVLAIVASTP